MIVDGAPLPITRSTTRPKPQSNLARTNHNTSTNQYQSQTTPSAVASLSHYTTTSIEHHGHAKTLLTRCWIPHLKPYTELQRTQPRDINRQTSPPTHTASADLPHTNHLTDSTHTRPQSHSKHNLRLSQNQITKPILPQP